MKKHVISALITGGFGIICAIIGIYAGVQKTISDLENSVGEISGDNATVTINDIDDFIEDYSHIKTSNARYAEQLEDTVKELDDTTKELTDLKKQLGDTPIFKFQDLGLSIDGETISLDSKNSMVTIDGRRYLAEEFIVNILDSKQELTIKDDMAYIGKIIKDKTDIAGQWIIEKDGVEFPDSVTDSYGNVYTNAMKCYNSGAYAIFSLNQEYSLFKCEIAMEENADIDAKGKITIKADDKVVYTSPILQKTGKTLCVTDIEIKDCSLLTIEYDVDTYGSGCIVSNASVYN